MTLPRWLSCKPVVTLTALLTVPVVAPRARGFLRWDEGRNQVFANLTAGLLFDSNIYAAAGGDEDMIYSALLGLEYQRRAGIIGVNANVGWTIARFGDNADENYENPSARVEFTKRTGRTTGSLAAGVQRESRAEPVVNFRTDSWNYETDFRFKYPVIERYSISGGVNYGYRDYQNNPLLVDLTTYGASTDLFYAYTSQRDLLAGYRIRVNETSADSRYNDHAFTVGVSGRILPKLNGTLRLGYQFRDASGPGAEDDEGYTAAGSATWNINRRASLTAQLFKDFSTTSTNLSIDSLGLSLDGRYMFNAHYAVGAGVGVGQNEFLGAAGQGRDDIYASANASATYTHSERFRLTIAYGLYENWSTLAVSDFRRHTVSLSVNSRF